MPSSNSFRLPRAILPVLLAVAVVSPLTPALATARNTPAGEVITKEMGWDAPKVRHLAASLGNLLVTRMEKARDYLNNGDITNARYAITVARNMSVGLKSLVPTVGIVDSFLSARKTVLTEEYGEFRDSLLPIYRELDLLQVFAPKISKSARAKLHQSDRAASAGNRKQAAQKLKEIASDISGSTIYLPVDYVSVQLGAAQYIINQPKPDMAAAKKAINKAINSMVRDIKSVLVE